MRRLNLIPLVLLVTLCGCLARLPTESEVRLSNDRHTDVTHAFLPTGERLTEFAADRTVMLIDGPNWRIIRSRGERRYYTPGDVASAGVLISDDGYVLTSAHGVDTGRLMAVLPGWTDGRARPRTARVVWTGFGASPPVDLALVKIDVMRSDRRLRHLPATAMQAGRPSRDEPLLLTGIAPDVGQSGRPPELVTAAGELIDVSDTSGLGDILHVAAPVRPGFSGGPALTASGDFAGITTQLTAGVRLARLFPLPTIGPRFTTTLARPDPALIANLIAADRQRSEQRDDGGSMR